MSFSSSDERGYAARLEAKGPCRCPAAPVPVEECGLYQANTVQRSCPALQELGRHGVHPLPSHPPLRGQTLVACECGRQTTRWLGCEPHQGVSEVPMRPPAATERQVLRRPEEVRVECLAEAKAAPRYQEMKRPES